MICYIQFLRFFCFALWIVFNFVNLIELLRSGVEFDSVEMVLKLGLVGAFSYFGEFCVQRSIILYFLFLNLCLLGEFDGIVVFWCWIWFGSDDFEAGPCRYVFVFLQTLPNIQHCFVFLPVFLGIEIFVVSTV